MGPQLIVGSVLGADDGVNLASAADKRDEARLVPEIGDRLGHPANRAYEPRFSARNPVIETQSRFRCPQGGQPTPYRLR